MLTLEIYSAVGIATLCAGQDGLHTHCQKTLQMVQGGSLRVWLTTARGKNGQPCRHTPVLWPWGLVGSNPPHTCLPPALCCQNALFCLATPSLAGVCTSQWWTIAGGLAGPAAVSSLADGRPQVSGVGGQPGPTIQLFPKPSRGVLRCIASELVRGPPASKTRDVLKEKNSYW